MGVGQADQSLQVIRAQQAALNTTRLVLNQINRTDLVLHIGDISYARGYASVVRRVIHTPVHEVKNNMTHNQLLRFSSVTTR